MVRELLENNLEAAAASRKSDSDSKAKRSDWVFIDSVTAVRFFRIDKAQENLHYVTDVCDERVLYILDEENEEDETIIDQVCMELISKYGEYHENVFNLLDEPYEDIAVRGEGRGGRAAGRAG